MVAAVSCLGAIGGSNLVIVGAARDALAAGYRVPLANLAWLTTGLGIAYAVLQIPTGELCDRWGPRRVAMIGAVGTLVVYLLACLAPHFGLGIVARVLAGITAAPCFLAGSDLVRALSLPKVVQGIFGGVALGSGGLAFALLPALGAGPLSWRSPWLFEVAWALAAVLLLLAVPATPGRGTARRASGRIVSRPLLAVGLAHSSTFALGVVVSNWLAVELARSAGVPVGAANAVTAVLLLATMLIRPWGGVLLDRQAPWSGIVIAPLAVGTAALVALTLPWGTAWSLACAAVFGLAAGLPFAALFDAGRRLTPQAPGLAIGVVNGMANVVILAGVPAFIAAIEAGGGRYALLAMAAFWVASLLAVRRVHTSL